MRLVLRFSVIMVQEDQVKGSAKKSGKQVCACEAAKQRHCSLENVCGGG